MIVSAFDGYSLLWVSGLILFLQPFWLCCCLGKAVNLVPPDNIYPSNFLKWKYFLILASAPWWVVFRRPHVFNCGNPFTSSWMYLKDGSGDLVYQIFFLYRYAETDVRQIYHKDGISLIFLWSGHFSSGGILSCTTSTESLPYSTDDLYRNIYVADKNTWTNALFYMASGTYTTVYGFPVSLWRRWILS